MILLKLLLLENKIFKQIYHQPPQSGEEVIACFIFINP